LGLKWASKANIGFYLFDLIWRQRWIQFFCDAKKAEYRYGAPESSIVVSLTTLTSLVRMETSSRDDLGGSKGTSQQDGWEQMQALDQLLVPQMQGSVTRHRVCCNYLRSGETIILAINQHEACSLGRKVLPTRFSNSNRSVTLKVADTPWGPSLQWNMETTTQCQRGGRSKAFKRRQSTVEVKQL
jgi:hypothetical protein